MSQSVIDRFLEEKQSFFLPYYVSIISEHPEGIKTPSVRAEARRRIISEHDFDPFDAELVGFNPTGAISSKQWANNLISNRVLHEYVLIVTTGVKQVTLFPLTTDHTTLPTPAASKWGKVHDALATAADHRTPRILTSHGSLCYARSAALAEFIRQRGQYNCIISQGSDCATFDGRDGNPYVEVHHVIPMAKQKDTAFNLDCSDNMVPVCVACHAKLHHGHDEEAKQTLLRLLDKYQEEYGDPFEGQMVASGINCQVRSLLTYYKMVQSDQ
jgi:hypothetical protein